MEVIFRCHGLWDEPSRHPAPFRHCTADPRPHTAPFSCPLPAAHWRHFSSLSSSSSSSSPKSPMSLFGDYAVPVTPDWVGYPRSAFPSFCSCSVPPFFLPIEGPRSAGEGGGGGGFWGDSLNAFVSRDTIVSRTHFFSTVYFCRLIICDLMATSLSPVLSCSASIGHMPFQMSLQTETCSFQAFFFSQYSFAPICIVCIYLIVVYRD